MALLNRARSALRASELPRRWNADAGHSAGSLHLHAGDLRRVNHAHAAVGREQHQQVAARRDEQVIGRRDVKGAPAREVKGERFERRHVPQLFDVFDAHTVLVALEQAGRNAGVFSVQSLL